MISLLFKLLQLIPGFAKALAEHQSAAYAELEKETKALRAETAAWMARGESLKEQFRAMQVKHAQEKQDWEDVIAASVRRSNELQDELRIAKAQVDRLSAADAVRVEL